MALPEKYIPTFEANTGDDMLGNASPEVLTEEFSRIAKFFDPTLDHESGNAGGIHKGNLCKDSETGENTSGIITDDDFSIEEYQERFDPVDGHKHDGTPESGGPIDSKNIINTPVGDITATNIQDAINQLDQTLNQYAGQIVIPESNYVIKGTDGNYGGKFSPGNGLAVNISALESMIGRKYHSNPAVTDFALNPRKASIVYQTKNDSSLIATRGHYDAVYPEADSRTVGRWIFNTAGTINDTVPTSSNYLNPSGTVNRVDGWADYAIQGNGTNGYYVSATSTGFPSSNQERELDIVFTPYNVSSINYIVEYGTASSNGWFSIYISASGTLCFNNYSTNYDTNFILEIGKTYFVALRYDGSILQIYVNGTMIYTLSITLNTVSGVMNILRAGNSTYYSNAIAHYLELRNTVRTPQQIAEISNKLCLPCLYIGYNASYPQNDTTSGASIWKFDDTSGTTVTDETTALNGTATGTSVIDSEIGLNKARKFNGTSSDYVTCGNVALSGDMTVIFVGKFNSAASLGRIIGNTNNIIMALSEPATTGVMGFYNSTTGWVNSKSPIQLDKNIFCAMSIKSGMLSFYMDSPFVDCTKPISWNATSSPLTIGRALNQATNTFNGFMDYLAIIPRSLSQVEIARYYNSFMIQKERTLIDDCLPENSISLGFVRTDSTSVIEYNDTDYEYMRNEGATKTEGNKRIQSEWVYATTYNPGSTPPLNRYHIKNPLGTSNIKVSGIKYKKNIYDPGYSIIDFALTSDGHYTGIWVSNITKNYIELTNVANSTSNQFLIFIYNSYTGTYETTGYVSVDIELL